MFGIFVYALINNIWNGLEKHIQHAETMLKQNLEETRISRPSMGVLGAWWHGHMAQPVATTSCWKKG